MDCSTRWYKLPFCVATLLLASCQRPDSSGETLSDDWGRPDHGLVCRLYLEHAPEQSGSDRDALNFQIKNVSSHHIVFPVNIWNLPKEIPNLVITVQDFPNARSGVGYGSSPEVRLHDLAPGETFTFHLAPEYAIATGQYLNGQWTRIELPDRPLAMTAEFQAAGTFEPRSATEDVDHIPVLPCWKGHIVSKPILMNLSQKP